MRFRMFFVFVFLGFAAVLFAQDWEFILDGRIEDLKRLPPQNFQQNDFTFVRLVYNGRIEGYNKNWYTDYPSGDRTAVEIVKRITNIDISKDGRAIPIEHQDLFKYPFVYSIEGGQMVLSSNEVFRMREYISRGGFWMIDDFWGTFEWNNFEREIKKVFPKKEIVEIPNDHPIFHDFFDIDEIIQVPNIGYAYCGSCPTWELDGYEPKVRGIFDEKGNLVVLILFNTDTMDALEWANDPSYPHYFSAYAYKIFVNSIIYSMSH